MNFLTDNFITNFFNNSTKTDEDLDKFINKKFTYYLNNSNLLLNFVSDFEDYKNTGRNDNKSKCDECENLYILTNEIFQNYINRVKIPFDITIYSEGKEKSNVNYNNKVLYFFDLKDLNKILQSKNLAKTSEDTKILNKKRILCKIISLSFIKIYIIIKSIFQTFNIYSSLIKNKTTVTNNTFNNELQPQTMEGEQFAQEPFAQEPFAEQPEQQVAQESFAEQPEQQVAQEPFAKEPFAEQPEQQFAQEPFAQETVAEQPEQQFAQEPVAKEPVAQELFGQPAIKEEIRQGKGLPLSDSSGLDNFQEPNNPFNNPLNNPFNNPPNNPFTGGAGIFDFLNPFSKKKEEIINEQPDELPRIKLQTSNNVFYSIFVILFENTELTSKNFTADYLTKSLDSITKETLINKLPKILNYICEHQLYLSKNILGNSIIFNDDNFKFLKLKTSDTLENDATYYLKEIDKKSSIDNSKKLKQLWGCFTKENVILIENYCTSKNLNLTNLSILNSVKSILQKLIANYFRNRNKLYDTIIKKLIKFNVRTNEIENINPNLTYAKIVELTEQTKDILLDLHIDIFKSLNSIVNKIRPTLMQNTSNQDSNTNTSEDEPLQGGKATRKHYKNYRNYRNYRNYKKTKKYKRR